MRPNKKIRIISLLSSFVLLAAMITGSVGSTARAQIKSEPRQAKVAHPALSRYAVNLTNLARLGRLEPAMGHRVELARLISLLAMTETPSPLNQRFESKRQSWPRTREEDGRGKVPDSCQVAGIHAQC
jgi:hypothetical protein